MRLLYSFFLILFAQVLFGQGVEVVYKVRYKPMVNSEIKEDYHILQICSNKKSSYFSAKMMALDSLQRSSSNISYENRVNLINSLDFNYLIYKNLVDKTTTFTQLTYDTFSYTEENSFVWKLGIGKKIISGYNCLEATCSFQGRIYTAFYTPDIPISDGPYKFQNLPGLILEVVSQDRDYSFEMASIKKNKDCDVDIVKGNAFKSRAEFSKFFTNYLKDPSADTRLRDSNNGSFSYEMKVNGKPVSREENYKRINNLVWDFVKTHNNPIEKNDLWLK